MLLITRASCCLAMAHMPGAASAPKEPGRDGRAKLSMKAEGRFHPVH